MHFRVLILLMLSVISAYASEDFDRQQIEQRIQPIGQVRIQEQQNATPKTTTTPETPAKTAKEEPGKEVYEKHCIVCHRDGVAGAPKFRVEQDWKARLSAKKLDGLTASAIKGLNAMPPKGTCMDCSDAAIKEAIQYMLPQA